jgi:hypothetical protein
VPLQQLIVVVHTWPWGQVLPVAGSQRWMHSWEPVEACWTQLWLLVQVGVPLPQPAKPKPVISASSHGIDRMVSSLAEGNSPGARGTASRGPWRNPLISRGRDETHRDMRVWPRGRSEHGGSGTTRLSKLRAFTTSKPRNGRRATLGERL